MDMRYVGQTLGRGLVTDSLDAMKKAQNLMGSPLGNQQCVPGPDRALDAHLRRLRSAREHAMHMNGRLNQMLDRLRGSVPQEAIPSGRVVSNEGPHEPPMLVCLADTMTSLNDTLDAIERAIGEIETIA